MGKTKFPLSCAIEHALATLEDNFELKCEVKATVRVPTSHLPAECLDALGIPEGQPVDLHWSFAREWMLPTEQPHLELTYCDHGHTQRLHEDRPPQASPYDKFLHQVKRIMAAHLERSWPPQDARAAQRIFTDAYQYLSQRIPTLSSFCVVCDAQLPSPGPKPVPCQDPKCIFAYDELGLGSGLTELFQSPAVADLLISMAAAAMQCTDGARRAKLFATVPAAFVLAPAKAGHEIELNWPKMTDCLLKIPSVDTITSARDMRTVLTQEELGLVRWILSTNRCHLAPLSSDEQFEEMGTKHQFRLTLSSTSQAASFALEKAEKGSFYAFHGSAFFNWHSILRSTIKNMSNTHMMSAGAAYGAGIYLAPTSSTSFSYSRGTQGWCNSRFGQLPTCIALCEVINGAPSSAQGGYAIVVPDESAVITRYLFVYESSCSRAVTASNLAAKCNAAASSLPWETLLQHNPYFVPQSSSASPEDAQAAKRQKPAKPGGLLQRAGRMLGVGVGAAAEKARPASGRRYNTRSASTAPVIDLISDDDQDGEEERMSDVQPQEAGGDADLEAREQSDGEDQDYDFAYGDSDDDMGMAEVASQPAAAANTAVREASSDKRLATATGATRLLIKELRNLSKMNTRAEGFEVHPVDEDNMLVWEAKLYLQEGSLAGQLQSYGRLHGQDYMKLRMHFPQDYPISPPFVWLVSPRLKFRTGFVSRGAICTTMLVNTGNSAGWSATYTIDKVLMVIRSNFQDAEARGEIDNPHSHSEYSEQEARNGFSHAKIMHGW